MDICVKGGRSLGAVVAELIHTKEKELSKGVKGMKSINNQIQI